MPNESVTVDDLLTNPVFQKWVRAPTRETEAYWQTFIDQHPSLYPLVLQARDILQGIDARAETDSPSAEQIQRIKRGINQRIQANETSVRPLWQTSWRWAAAASIALVVSLGWLLYTNESSSDTLYHQLIAQSKKPLQELVNTGSRPMQVELPDHSTVVLQPNSRISYAIAEAGTNRREVYLTGEAFFTVQKNPDRPFLVYANELVTKVLGTSFWVKAFDKEASVTVLVRTGKVAVFNRTDPKAEPLRMNRELAGIILTPNQQLVFNRPAVRMQKTLVANPVLITPAAKTPTFIYRDEPVGQVFDELEKAYGIHIVYDATTMRHCLLTASLTEESLYEKLRLICKSIQAQYQLQGEQIVITSPGCY